MGLRLFQHTIMVLSQETLKDTTLAVLEDTDLIVTTTGNVNVCDEAMLRSVKNTAVICNIGHFDNEIDTQFMREMVLGGNKTSSS